MWTKLKSYFQNVNQILPKTVKIRLQCYWSLFWRIRKMGFHPNDFNLWSSKFPTILWIRRVERGTQISGLGYKLQFSAHPHLTDMAFLGLLCLRGTSLQDWIFIFSLFDESEKPQKINGDDLQFFAFSPLVFLTPSRLLVGWYFDRKLQGFFGLQPFLFNTIFLWWTNLSYVSFCSPRRARIAVWHLGLTPRCFSSKW